MVLVVIFKLSVCFVPGLRQQSGERTEEARTENPATWLCSVRSLPKVSAQTGVSPALSEGRGGEERCERLNGSTRTVRGRRR